MSSLRSESHGSTSLTMTLSSSKGQIADFRSQILKFEIPQGLAAAGRLAPCGNATRVELFILIAQRDSHEDMRLVSNHA